MRSLARIVRLQDGIREDLAKLEQEVAYLHERMDQLVTPRGDKGKGRFP